MLCASVRLAPTCNVRITARDLVESGFATEGDVRYCVVPNLVMIGAQVSYFMGRLQELCCCVRLGVAYLQFSIEFPASKNVKMAIELHCHIDIVT